MMVVGIKRAHERNIGKATLTKMYHEKWSMCQLKCQALGAEKKKKKKTAIENPERYI